MTEFTVDIDTERIQREALLILFDNLNDKIDELEEEFNAEDDDFYNHMGLVSPGFSVEQISTDNFHAGTLAPLLTRPIEEFPNCCTIAYVAEPTGSTDDQAEFFQIRLAVEVMVKSQLSEMEVNSRIKKTIKAVRRVFLDGYDNRKLNGLVSSMGEPRETTGDVFAVVRNDQRWYWQGGSLTYPVLKYVQDY